MQKGQHVIHKDTGREGRIESFDNTLPTTINVKWVRDETISTHEVSELDMSLCNKEHSMYKGIFCCLRPDHIGWCGCN